MIRDLIDYANKQKGLPGYTLIVMLKGRKGDVREGKLLEHGDDWMILDLGTDCTAPVYIPEHAIKSITINW